jgi:hypothetical protein
MSRLFILMFLLMGLAWFILYQKRGTIKKTSFIAMRQFLVVLLISVSTIGILSVVISTIKEASK